MKVSVVIPTHNRRRSLLRCLANVSQNVEVVVIDDGSSDGTSEAIRRVKHPYLVYVRQADEGPASARNTGIDLASGDYIAFTDDDCLPLPPWPWPLVERLEQEGSQVAGVGGRVLPLHDGLFSRYYTLHRILEPPESCSYLVTANCAYRREALLSVGGFDTRIKHPGGEDPGLSISVRANGYSLVFEPRAVVQHDYRESLFDFSRTFFRYGKGCAIAVGEDGRRAWANELAPPHISPRTLWDDIAYGWEHFGYDTVPFKDKAAFVALRVVQRFAYNVGWNSGTRKV